MMWSIQGIGLTPNLFRNEADHGCLINVSDPRHKPPRTTAVSGPSPGPGTVHPCRPAASGTLGIKCRRPLSGHCHNWKRVTERGWLWMHESGNGQESAGARPPQQRQRKPPGQNSQCRSGSTLRRTSRSSFRSSADLDGFPTLTASRSTGSACRSAAP